MIYVGKNYTHVDNSNVFSDGSRVSAVQKGFPGAATIIEAMNNHEIDWSDRNMPATAIPLIGSRSAQGVTRFSFSSTMN